MKEIVIISGKGGTGKTSVTSSFATLAKNAVLVDCDVDAADLHLILNPKVITRNDFISGHEAVIRTEDCIGCGICEEQCRFESISCDSDNKYHVDPTSCEGCSVCVEFCPVGAIDFPDRNCGEWFESETRFGPMIHARLGIAAENSGKLVSVVRQQAKRIAEEKEASLILVDGPPGTGCPVIASITGCDGVVVVTEPTLSGIHDLERILALTKHFDIQAYVCVNKWDINPDNTAVIEEFVVKAGATFLGKVSYSKEVTKSQIIGESVVESGCGVICEEITQLWMRLCQLAEIK